MTPMSLEISVPFVLIMVLCAVSDVQVRRIPNALTVTGIVAAPILWALVEGSTGALASIAGGGLALVVVIPLFALGALGGGDAKLLMVTGTFLGPTRFVVALVAIGITGAVLAVAVAFREGRLLRTLWSAWQLCLHLITLGSKGIQRQIESPGALTIPYGVAIAAGALMTWFVSSAGSLAQ